MRERQKRALKVKMGGDQNHYFRRLYVLKSTCALFKIGHIPSPELFIHKKWFQRRGLPHPIPRGEKWLLSVESKREFWELSP